MRRYPAGPPKTFPIINKKTYFVQLDNGDQYPNTFNSFGPFRTETEAEQFCRNAGGTWLIHAIGRIE